MRAVDCPACAHGFVKRSGRRCPRCKVWLVHEGEDFYRDGDRVFLWLAAERKWSEVLA